MDRAKAEAVFQGERQPRRPRQIALVGSPRTGGHLADYDLLGCPSRYKHRQQILAMPERIAAGCRKAKLVVTISSRSVDVRAMDRIKPWMHDIVASILAAMILKKRLAGLKRYD
ncbi:hypothetical protein [Rhizobium wenxiniae]|uniref:hypothetical protein n=1 Tax=Rhizobium wenxiniae TaxID=1737357 RepID=UPI003C1F47C5